MCSHPLIDLHLHLDGSLSLSAVRELASLQQIPLPAEPVLRSYLQVDAHCRDLNQYLTKFDFPLSLLQTSESISLAVQRLCQELESQGLIYAEIRFAPQLHTQKGLTQDQVVQAALIGLRRAALPTGLILCCMRGDHNHEDNLQTVETAVRYLGQGVCALDLAGAEALYPTECFEDLFRLASQHDLPFTIHAGEAAGPDSIRTALRCGASRIGHGVRAIEDPDLLFQLADQNIILELCPTSNLNTQIFSDIREYPLRLLMEAGVKITINTDNMTVSNTTLCQELALVTRAFSLSPLEVQTLMLNAADAAFAPKELKARLRSQIMQ